MRNVLLAGILLPLSALATPLEEAVDFLSWLEKHAKDFAACEPALEGDSYVLCDKTKVDRAELRKLLAMKAPELVAELRSKGLKVLVVCDAEAKNPPLGKDCTPSSGNKMFEELDSLHGKYLPAERKILIRSSASRGSLVHEYVHHLQSENGNEIYGKAYKRKRNELQEKLEKLMDEKIALIEELEKAGKREETKPHLQEFLLAAEAVRGFAPWQDLIDERGIFLLYLRHGKELGAGKEDLALARKNMGFLCKNPKLAKLLPTKQCAL